jgi:hypothetical protein
MTAVVYKQDKPQKIKQVEDQKAIAAKKLAKVESPRVITMKKGVTIHKFKGGRK